MVIFRTNERPPNCWSKAGVPAEVLDLDFAGAATGAGVDDWTPMVGGGQGILIDPDSGTFSPAPTRAATATGPRFRRRLCGYRDPPYPIGAGPRACPVSAPSSSFRRQPGDQRGLPYRDGSRFCCIQDRRRRVDREHPACQPDSRSAASAVRRILPASLRGSSATNS